MIGQKRVASPLFRDQESSVIKLFGKREGNVSSSAKMSLDVQNVEVWTCPLETIVATDCPGIGPFPYPPLAKEYVRRVSAGGLGKIIPFEADDYPRNYHVTESRYDYDTDREIYAVPTDLPDFFHLFSSTICVKRHLADVFMRHNLGKSRLFPVSFFQHDEITPIPGEYFGIYFGEAKAAVSFEQSSGVKIFRSYEGPLFKRDRSTGIFAVRRSALDELDLWIDSQCLSSFFMSGRLKRALDDAGMKPNINFSACHMV
jgi:hypothetical protein